MGEKPFRNPAPRPGRRTLQPTPLRSIVSRLRCVVSRCGLLGEERANVFQMREKAFGIRVGFATENFIAVDSESIEKVLLLARRVPNESREPRLERLSFSG
jgi:hypothetical protein